MSSESKKFLIEVIAITAAMAAVLIPFFRWRNSVCKEDKNYTYSYEEVVDACAKASIVTTTAEECGDPVINEEIYSEECNFCETTTEEITETDVEIVPLYSVNGFVMDAELQTYLWERLTEKHIEYWMPIAVAQAYQESNFDTTQITNGIDMGLYQYRNPYWNEWCDRAGEEHGDIFDAYKQIDVYTEMVRQWIEAGHSESRVISNHNTGGWGDDYSEEYVSQVSQWFDTTERIN